MTGVYTHYEICYITLHHITFMLIILTPGMYTTDGHWVIKFYDHLMSSVLSLSSGWKDVGFNNPLVKTPNIDQMARDGIDLTNHYVQPMCSP